MAKTLMFFSVLMVGAAGCGSQGAVPDGGVDSGAEEADGGVEPYVLSFQGGGVRPGLLAVRNGSGPWEPISLDANGSASFMVTAGYHSVASACPRLDAPPRMLRIDHAARAPMAPIVPCRLVLPPVTISGRVVPVDATVIVGGVRATVTNSGDYSVSVQPRVYDVAAFASTARLLLRRGETIVANATLDLDVEADGFDAVRASVTVENAGDQHAAILSEFVTANGSVLTLPDLEGAAWLVPVAERAPGDVARVTAVAGDLDGIRIARVVVSDATVPVLRLPPAAMLSADSSATTWQGTGDNITTRLIGDLNNLTMQLVASREWFTAAGGWGRLDWVDPAAIPGWNPAWPTLVAGQSYYWYASLSTGAPDGDSTAFDNGHEMIW